MQRFALVAALSVAASSALAAQELASLTPTTTVSQRVRRAAPPAAPLDRPVTVRLDDAPLATALRAIAAAAGIPYAFSDDLVPAGVRVDVDVREVRAADALRQVLRGTGLVSALTADGRLTVRLEQRAALARITGRVTDEGDGRPVGGVFISLEGTNFYTRTNDEGRYLLRDIPAGTYTISARRVGYTRERVQVTVRDDAMFGQDFSLRQTANRLNTVVVTGSLVETQLKAIPIDLTVITAEQIAERNITNVEQLFRGSVPGVFIEDEGYLSRNPMETKTPQIHGQAFLNGDAGRTSTLKTYIDGILVTDYSVVSQLDPSSIERIEFVSGAGASTMYGSGASDGVMQIFTKRGAFGGRTQTQVELSAFAFDSPYMSEIVVSPRATARVSGGTDAVSFHLGGAVEQHGEWVPNYGHVTRNLNAGMAWRGTRFQIDATADLAGPNRYEDVYWGNSFTQLLLHEGIASRAKLGPYALMPSGAHIEAETQRFGATARFDATPTWQHSLTLGTSSSLYQRLQDSPTFATVSDTLRSFSESRGQMTTLSYFNSWRLGLPHGISSVLTSGLEHTALHGGYASASGLQQLEGSLRPSFTSMSRTDNQNTGYFAQSQLGFRDEFFVTTGVRAEQNPDYGQDVNLRPAPTFGAAYAKTLGKVTAKVRMNYGWASKPPLPYQRDGQPSYISGQTATVTTWYHTLANPDLLPSETRGTEYGADLFLGRWLSLSVTGENKIGKNAIYTDQIRVDTTELSPGIFEIDQYWHNGNRGDVRTVGGQVTAQVRWRDFWLRSTYGSYSNIILVLPRGQIYSSTLEEWRVGKRIGYLPSYTAGTTVGYSGRNLQVNVEAVSRGRQEGQDQAAAERNRLSVPELAGPPLPGRIIQMGEFTKFNVSLNQRVSSEFTAFMVVTNALDTRVVEAALDNRRPEAGRMFRFGTRWTHGGTR